MKRWFSILVPVLILGMLITWRIDQKKADMSAQTQQRSSRMNAPAMATLAAAEMRSISHNFEAIVQQQAAALAEAQYRVAQAQMNQNPADVAVNTQIKQQKAGVASAEADYNQSQKSYEAQLASAEANLADAQSKIENAKSAVNGAKANLDNAKTKYDRIYNLYKQGYIAAQEVDDAKATVTVQQSSLEIAQGLLRSATVQKESVQQQYNIVRAKGKTDVEASHAKSIQASASLEYAQANTSQKSAYRQSIAALRASVAVAKASLESAKSKRRDTTNKLVDQALTQRPEVQQAQQNVQAAAYGVNAARTSDSPSIGATAGWLQKGSDFPPDNNSLTYGVAIQWTPFDAGLTKGRVKEAQANYQSLQAQFESVKLGITTEVSQAYLNLMTAEQRVITADAEIANAEEALRLVEGRYQSGLGTFLDVLDAQTALLTAKTNRVNAQSAADQARAAMLHAIGTPSSQQVASSGKQASKG